MSVGISCFVGWSEPEQMIVACGLSQLFSKHVVLLGVASREAALDRVRARELGRVFFALDRRGGLTPGQFGLQGGRATELGWKAAGGAEQHC